MYKAILRDIQRQLRQLENERSDFYGTLERAWCAAREWATTGTAPKRNTELLVPYIGSGLNRLSDGGVGSWQELVKEIAAHTGGLGSDHQVKRSGLTMPQQLELHLQKAETKKSFHSCVVEAFETRFGGKQKPSEFHKRLTRMFPRLLTTNYNDLLKAAAGPKREVIDLTDPGCDLRRDVPAIIHLHGRLLPAGDREELERRIFAGVGLHKEFVRPCLVVTEHQYHRIYADSGFEAAIEQVLGPPNFLLFLGASLASDELGIHRVLTSRRLESGDVAGLYVTIELDPLKQELLKQRGIHCISLPRRYGYSRAATEALLMGSPKVNPV